MLKPVLSFSLHALKRYDEAMIVFMRMKEQQQIIE